MTKARKIVKRNDHLMDATRYLIVSGRRVMSIEPRPTGTEVLSASESCTPYDVIWFPITRRPSRSEQQRPWARTTISLPYCPVFFW